MDGTYRKSHRRNYQLLDHSGRALREIQPGDTEPPFPEARGVGATGETLVDPGKAAESPHQPYRTSFTRS